MDLLSSSSSRWSDPIKYLVDSLILNGNMKLNRMMVNKR